MFLQSNTRYLNDIDSEPLQLLYALQARCLAISSAEAQLCQVHLQHYLSNTSIIGDVLKAPNV